MKRKNEPPPSDLEEARADRDAAILKLNERLSDKQERMAMEVLPQATFARLVRANRKRMCWDAPEAVFEAADTEPVRMATADFDAFLEKQEDPALAALLRELFVTNVQFVQWVDFIERFEASTDKVIERLHEWRAHHPRRLTLLVLPFTGVNKSNAWLAGFMWRKLAAVVDYVVSSWFSVKQLVEAVNDARFEFDVLYIDDMLYSGQQAFLTLFGPKWEKTLPLRMHLIVPFIAEPAVKLLREAAKAAKVLGMYLSRSTTEVVPRYRAKVADVIAAAEGAFPALAPMFRKLAKEKLPAIVFEHKLADDVSVPLFLLQMDVFGLGMPPLVRNATPFYKSHTMRWHVYGSDTSAVVTRFTFIDARLWAALLAVPYHYLQE